MRVFRRGLFILITLLLAGGLLIAGGWWGLNRYVGSPGFATFVKKEGTRLTGAPLDFHDIIWELGRGITLNAPVIANGEKFPARGEFKADQVILKYEWSSIFAGRFEINRLTLKQPVLIIGQDAAGNLVLPVNPPAAATVTTTASTPAATPTPESTADKSSPIEIACRKFNLEKGTVEVKNHDGSTRLLCSGIDTEGRLFAGEKTSLRGSISIGEIWLLQKVKITSLRSAMQLEGDTFSLTGLEADAYGGRINGVWEQNFSDAKKPYNLKLNLDDCDVNAVISGVMQQTGIISGRLDAKTLWIGPSTEPMAVSGKGTVELHGGQLINVPFFRVLAQLLGVAALQQPDFSECKIEYTIVDQVATISVLQLKSALFELSGTGTVGFDGALKMQCRLDLNPELVKQIPAAMSGALEKQPNGYSSIPFKLGGTLSDPKVELVITQGMVQQATDLIRGLFGKKEKKPEAPAPATATPAPAAVVTTTASTTTTTVSAPTPAPVPATTSTSTPQTNAPAGGM